jgi:hypothetical protein
MNKTELVLFADDQVTFGKPENKLLVATNQLQEIITLTLK